MSVVFVLLLASLLVATGFLFAFFWAVKSGQYEDTTTPSMRILSDDDSDAASDDDSTESEEQT
ncbi:MAG: cbb3-type cytochrome oxidase assembly protein CcoS [Verrucomicrobia bacterium]|nr:cbb3-type cytochrome oxidase assembly protein CcoS [Verrucomicrobiota bacterium]